MRRSVLLLPLFFLLVEVVHAQGSSPSGEVGRGLWDDFVEEYTSDVERAEEEDLQLHLQELKELSEHPLNINTATVEDFLQLPFLSEAQIEQIHAYIYLHGQMQTLSELRLVPLIDDVTRRRLSLFTYAEPEQDKAKDKLFSHLRHDFSTRLDIPLYYRLGQQQENGYRGDALYHRMRYQLGNSRHFQAGLRVEKDAGERYYDSYGAYAMLHDVGILDRAVVGDYRIGFGEGLVLGGSTWNSKSTPPLKTQGGIRPMAGMDETNFLRGAAVTLALNKHLKLSAFGSYRKRDATLTSEGEVQTLRTDGYHRTASEWERRRNVGSTVVGGNISWYNKGLHLGATGYWQKFSRTLNPGSQQYRAIYPKGNAFGTVGMNYGYTRYRLSFAGETAYSTAGGGWATINRASWAISRGYVLSAVQRFYAYQYYSFYASSLAENSNAQNESGVLLHLQAEPLAGLQLTAYADFFHHPWPRYRMTHSSTGQDFFLQGSYAVSRRHTLLARYQLKRKENGDVMEPHHRIKLQWTAEQTGRWRLQTTGLYHNVLGSNGFMLSQSARWMLLKPNLTLNAQLGYFNTDDYLSRIYLNSPALYSTFSSSSYFGHGVMGVLTCRWKSKNEKLWLEGRYSLLRYFDRDEQGTALQQILSPWKNDLSFQLRVKI
ncbi:MAG: helix-hairpin-helix domain-containing protein [Bacteroidaceae bacterium]|nr:helix-hairpin-helix domain-containing protein [Bacteroidaceae bacterium]